jgi:hypothetical protein
MSYEKRIKLALFDGLPEPRQPSLVVHKERVYRTARAVESGSKLLIRCDLSKLRFQGANPVRFV